MTTAVETTQGTQAALASAAEMRNAGNFVEAERICHAALAHDPENADIFDFVINCDLVEYMRLTYETLALCQWHKRFAQSVLKAESGGGD